MTDRRDEIAEMFKKYFHHYGMKKTSVDDVAAEMHISKKTIYEYFESKEAVFAFIIQQEAEQAGQSMLRRMEGLPSAAARLRMLIHLIFDNVSLYVKSSHGLDLHDRDDMAMRIFQAAYESILLQVVDDGVRAGEFNLPEGDLNRAFLKGIILQGLQTLRADPDCRVELPTGDAVFKLLS
jgi:TetR/AcrR family transcriptional regulator